MTEDLKKIYKWNPAEGDYIKNDAIESTLELKKKIRNENFKIGLLVFASLMVLFVSLYIFS